ncbi:hypothetical protein, partial [Enterocloster bolteae]|uniref:hypothetical protein n=1 Tax=Enterocloster bolteae TaxID=208479 RepID=UPI001A9AAF9D
MENKRKIPKIPAMAYIASHTGIQGFFIFKPISRHKPEKYRILRLSAGNRLFQGFQQVLSPLLHHF